ncbi:hypothetical protein PC9H_008451 [Pleurotus ostreatus]|uniref:Uncharacterized protein n=1 Tax=Pleurotus ostreatus TaxID=5322 RepID=A0A8H6ZVT0_PLEOS|nr:uncharacterized protein PC9H_008451 [Pleurotus ostreatus]KAF7426085.1 hypothetical protein PC9H_008451 [Pleurotus ostreatus]
MSHHHSHHHPHGSTISAGDPHMSYLTSPFISRRALLFVRIVIALFTVSTCLTVMIYSATHARGGGDAGQFLYFSYFTSLSFIGVTTWTVIQAVRVAKMVWFGRDIADEARVDRGREGNRVDDEETRSEKELAEEKEGVSVAELGETGDRNETEERGGEKRGSKVSSLAYEVLYCTITTFPILVTIIYWALLSSPSTFATSYSAYSSTSQHILNAVVSLAETFVLTSSPSATNSASVKPRKTNLPYIYLPITVVLLGLYLCVAYITNANQGVYVYPFLDPSKGPILAAYIVGIGLAQCVVFVFVRCGIMLRDWAIRT